MAKKIKDKLKEFGEIEYFNDYMELVGLHIAVGMLEPVFEEVERYKDINDKYWELRELVNRKIDEFGEKEIGDV